MSKSAGQPLGLTAADTARFRAQVVATAGCHVWVGALGRDGYGRFWLRRADGRQRVVTPHLVAATIAHGELAAGVTLMHDCDVRLCVRPGAGHLHVGTQAENVRQAVSRGRSHGPHPGLVDVRGAAGQSRAIRDALQAAVRASTIRDDPMALALTVAQVLAAGDPLRHNLTLFDPVQPAGVAAGGGDVFGDPVEQPRPLGSGA